MIQCFIKRDIQISRRFRQGQPHFRTGERVHPKRPFQMRLPGPYRDVGIEGNPLRATTTEGRAWHRSEEHTSELQSPMRISYAVFCLKKKITQTTNTNST